MGSYVTAWTWHLTYYLERVHLSASIVTDPEEPPGNRPLSDEMVASARKRLFGSWEMNWMAYNFAQDIELPGSSGTTLPFLMYPQAQTAEGTLDSLDPDSFKYEITASELT